MAKDTSYENYPRKINELRKSLDEFVGEYLDHRQPDALVGEVLDADGCALNQYGLGGTAFLLALRKNHNIDGAVLNEAKKALDAGFQIAHEQRNEVQKKLFKDVPRISTKAVLTLFLFDKKQPLNKILKILLEDAVAGGLIKLVVDSTAVTGNAIATAQVLQMIHFSQFELNKGQLKNISGLVGALRKQLFDQSLNLHQCLYISTTICLFDYDSHIKHHRKILRKLYAEDRDWLRTLSSHTQFMDVWYPDPQKNNEQQRYIRIPVSFVIFSAIYVAIGSEVKFFKFKPVKEMYAQITTPYKEYAREDNLRATAYNVFFQYIALYPSKYLRVKSAPWSRRMVNQIQYRLENLTKIGWLVLCAVIIGILRAGAMLYGFIYSETSTLINENEISNLVTTAALVVTGALGLLRTKKK